MPIKDKPSLSEMLLDPAYDMEELIKQDLYRSFHNPTTDGLYKPTKPKEKIKPKIIKPREKPKAIGQNFKARQNSYVALGQRLSRIDRSIQNEKDLSKKAHLVQEFYEVHRKLDRESERVSNKYKPGTDNDT